MYKYGTLLIIASALSAMEQPNEGKMEIPDSSSVSALSFDDLKMAFSKHALADSEGRDRAARLAAYLSQQNDPLWAWKRFGALGGRVVPGVDNLTVISTQEERLHTPLARAAYADVGIFSDALRGKLFIGTGFGPHVKNIGYLPSDIEVSYFDAHIPQVSQNGEFIFCWGRDGGLYLIPIDGFSTEKALTPIKGTENWKSGFCDFRFINDSESVLYNGQAVFRGSIREVFEHGVSKLSKLFDCGRLDQNICTQNNSVLHVFGGRFLAFKPTGSVVSNRCGVRVYDLADGTAKFFKTIPLPETKNLCAIHTAFDATSLVLRYLDKSSDIVWFDTDLAMKGVRPNVKATDCLFSPDGDHMLFFDRDTKELALATLLGGTYTHKTFSLADIAPNFLRWDTSGIHYTGAGDAGVIYWNRLPSLLERYKKSVTPQGAEKPSKRKVTGDEGIDAKFLKS